MHGEYRFDKVTGEAEPTGEEHVNTPRILLALPVGTDWVVKGSILMQSRPLTRQAGGI